MAKSQLCLNTPPPYTNIRLNVLAVFITALMGIMAFGHGNVSAQPQACNNAPANLRVSNITTTTTDVTWQRTGPPQNVCGWILDYRVVTNNPNDPWTTITLLPNPTSFTLFNLTPNTNYQARVRTLCCNQTVSQPTITGWRTATDCNNAPTVAIQQTNPPFLPGQNNNFTATVPSTAGNVTYRWYLRSNPNNILSSTPKYNYTANVVSLNDALCLSVTWSPDCEPIVNCYEFNTLVPVCTETCNNTPPVPGPNAIWVNNVNINFIAPNPNLNNAEVWVSGTLTMNQNRTLRNCRFVMLQNSQVVQNANITTNVNGTEFIGCDGLWQGIQLNNPSRWNSANQGNTRSLICSADRGITFGNNSITNLVNTDFFDNNTGLAGQNHTTNLTAANGFLVAGCNFTRFVRGTDGIVISDNTPINTPVAYPNIRIGDLPGNSPRFNNFTNLTNDGIVIAPAAVSSVSNLIDIQWASMVRCRYGVNIQGNQRVTGNFVRNTLVQFTNMNLCQRGINFITNSNITAIWNNLRNIEEAGIWSGGANGSVTITNNTITNTPTGEMCIFVGSISASLTNNNTLTISNNNPLDFGRRGILVDSYIGGLITITQNSLRHIGNNLDMGLNGFTGIQGIRVYNDQGDNAFPSGANAFIGNNNITFNGLQQLRGINPNVDIATGIMVSSLTGRIRVGQEILLGPTAPNVISFNNNYRGVGIDLTQPSSASTSWVIGNTINGPTHTGIRTVGINSPNITCNNVVLSNIGLLPNPFPITNPDPNATNNQFTPAQINVGIDVSSSTGAFQVDGNSVTGDATVLIANRFSVGINMTNNPTLANPNFKQMTCNALVDLHTGIRFSGNNFWSNMTNNDMRNNQWGMWFDRQAIVGPQGGALNPTAVNDNTWLNANGQSTRVMSSNQTNSTLNQPFRFRSTNPNLFSPLVSDIILSNPPPTPVRFFIVNTTQVQTDCGFRPVCLNPGNTLVTPGGYLSIRPQLEHIALAAPDPSDEIAVASDFTAKQTLFNYLHTVSLLRDSSVILHDAYDSLKVSNIAKIWKVDSLITAGDTLTARAVNISISPQNIMEQNYKTANAVLLKTVCSSADSSAVGGAPHCLTGNCVNALRPIANQCVYKGGQGVYLARTLLALRDTEIRDYDDNCWYNNLLLPKQTQVQQVNGAFEVYPNPAKDELNIAYELPKGVTQADLVLVDALGKTIQTDKIMKPSGVLELRTESLPEGFYLLKLSGVNFSPRTFKVMIAR